MEPLKSKLLVLLFSAVAALTVGWNLQADAAEIWTTANATTISHNSFPQLKVNLLVWQARGGTAGAASGSDDWEIFLFNIESQVMTQVTDDDYDDIAPQTDGDYVVWQKHDTSRANQIFLYKSQGDNPPGGRMISSDESMDHYAPKMAAGWVVWTSQRVAESFEPGQIMLYDAKSLKGPESISDNAFDCSFPRIDGQTVTWVQSKGDGSAALFVYDLTGERPESEPAPEGFVWEDSPQRDGDLTVLTGHDGTDREVFVYDASLKTYEQITDNSYEDSYPRISGTNLAWVGGEGQDSEIFLRADMSSEPPAPDSPSGGSGGGSCFIGTASHRATVMGNVHMLIPVFMGATFVALFMKKGA